MDQWIRKFIHALGDSFYHAECSFWQPWKHHPRQLLLKDYQNLILQHTVFKVVPLYIPVDARMAPYLILGAENYVVKQPLLELTRDYDRIVKKPRSILVTGNFNLITCLLNEFITVEFISLVSSRSYIEYLEVLLPALFSQYWILAVQSWSKVEVLFCFNCAKSYVDQMNVLDVENKSNYHVLMW